jgi:hypothetical protein
MPTFDFAGLLSIPPPALTPVRDSAGGSSTYASLFPAPGGDPETGTPTPPGQDAPSGNFFIFRCGENRKPPGDGTLPQFFTHQNPAG